MPCTFALAVCRKGLDIHLDPPWKARYTLPVVDTRISLNIPKMIILQMGGVEGVEATEINRLTLQPGVGLWMNAIPRASQA